MLFNTYFTMQPERGKKGPCTWTHVSLATVPPSGLAPTIIFVVPVWVLGGGLRDTGVLVWAGVLVAVVIVIGGPICRGRNRTGDTLVIRPKESILGSGRGPPLP